VKAEIEPCPLATQQAIIQLLILENNPQFKQFDDLVVWVADEIIPYCSGIEAVSD
jgi:hypothetical protein